MEEVCVILINYLPPDELDDETSDTSPHITTKSLILQFESNAVKCFSFSSFEEAQGKLLEYLNQKLFIIVRFEGEYYNTSNVAKNFASKLDISIPLNVCFWGTNCIIGSSGRRRPLIDDLPEQTVTNILVFCAEEQAQYCRTSKLPSTNQSANLYENVKRQNIFAISILFILVSVLYLQHFFLYSNQKISEEKGIIQYPQVSEMLETCLKSDSMNVMEDLFEISVLNSCEKLIVEYYKNDSSRAKHFLKSIRVYDMNKIAFALCHEMNKQEAMDILKLNSKLLFYMKDEMKDDPHILHQVFQNFTYVSHFELRIKTVELKSFDLYNNSSDLIFADILNQNGLLLMYAPLRIRQSIEHVQIAGKQNKFSFQLAADPLRNNVTLVKKIIGQ